MPEHYIDYLGYVLHDPYNSISVSDWAAWLHELYNTILILDWTAWLTLTLILFFAFGVCQSIRTYHYARCSIRHQIDAPKPTLKQIQELAREKSKGIPFILILVPARDEAGVISNTISCLTQLDYPRRNYAVVVITDEREQADESALTTSEIAREWATYENREQNDPWLYVVEVPAWYSGYFGSLNRTFNQSTKGRALNYALQYLCGDERLSRADMLGILDADGRMHQESLREVAFKYLRDDEKVLQGPVFQISNYPNVTMSGKAAGIELSIYHLSTLAHRLQDGKHRAEFLAGTNYFIDLDLLIELGGWNNNALVEDAELGLRLFTEKQIKPGWLSCHEIEQTPPDYKVYLKQRQRWALGHFQLLPMIRQAALPFGSKLSLYGRVLSGILKSPLDIALPILGWLALFLGWTQGLPQWLGWVMISLFVGSIFVWDYFGRGYRLIKKYTPIEQQTWTESRIHQMHFILLMPWLILLQAQPRLVALYKHITGLGDSSWVKTRRTIEEPSVVIELLARKDARDQTSSIKQQNDVKKVKSG